MIHSLLFNVVIAFAFCVVSTASTSFHFLVVRDDCWAPFFIDFPWLSLSNWTSPSSPLRDCVAATVSKSLGYGIILGSCAVKLPQVLNIVRARSGAGLSLASQYQELVSNALAVVWHISWNFSPFSAYGETIIVTLGCAIVVLCMWAFERPSVGHIAAVVSVVAALVQLALLPPSTATVLAQAAATALGAPASGLSATVLKDLLQFLSQLTFWGARITQIIVTTHQRSNGAQSPVTLVFNLAGTMARVFTSMREVRDPLQLAFTMINVLLNGVLCLQYLQFSGVVQDKTSMKMIKATTSTSASASKASRAAGTLRRR